MYDKKGFAKRIRGLRVLANKTQKEVAEGIGVSVDTIRKLEKGTRLPSVAVVELLCNYYNTTADYIISGIEPSNSAVEEMLNSLPQDKKYIIEGILKDIKNLIE